MAISEETKKRRQIEDLNDLRKGWKKYRDFLAPILPPGLFGAVEWLATASKADILHVTHHYLRD